jgi:hypothetical protein
MAVIFKLATFVLVGALAGCSLPSSPGGSSAAGTSSSSVATPSARSGLGAASPSATPSPVVSVVEDATFQSPSKNITCVLTTSSVRCDIARKTWTVPTRPASCQLDWGNGMYLNKGVAGFVCAGDTVAGTATRVLPYGTSLRAGTVQCDSGNAALRCVDTSSQHGFTLAVADYNLF